MEGGSFVPLKSIEVTVKGKDEDGEVVVGSSATLFLNIYLLYLGIYCGVCKSSHRFI